MNEALEKRIADILGYHFDSEIENDWVRYDGLSGPYGDHVRDIKDLIRTEVSSAVKTAVDTVLAQYAEKEKE